ncbi:ABC transporter permease [Anaerolinea thermophila]|uniref:ABC transporter permease protein n=1 Tax=Anaerolinea thermophila (strain DSM 14523 / JCM 11388 / NBRC 100420 / UNI-1) TaxID=926569 RepID=E8N2I7_ANATU|nr:ABC transporter permease subunit [Anaerolinea thermophila]BAJ62793.1 putative ABC transporter permease protein [Anaerolinea thermophila UNI-1]
MTLSTRSFSMGTGSERRFGVADVLVLFGLAALLYAGIRLALNAPPAVREPVISLQPQVLPWYALRSVSRMFAAYLLSMAFTLIYGRVAAYNRRAEQVLIPLLDVLQSVPILSFLPVVLLGLRAILPEGLAAELSSVVLIFTSQVWNLTFAWYQSLRTIPKELREASAIFRLNTWFQFKTLELPFAAIALVWNSMMSWAGGWFFLMAAEIFTVGEQDYRLPGLGAYLHEAANQGNIPAIFWGVLALILTIIILDQLVWRPLMAWTERFKLEMVENDNPPTSWFYNLIGHSRIIHWLNQRIFTPINEAIDARMARWLNPPLLRPAHSRKIPWGEIVLGLVCIGVVLYWGAQALRLLFNLSLSSWSAIALGIGATFLRVLISLLIALAWTIPVGVAIGTNPRLASLFQPLVQVVASVPATAIFPIFVLLLIQLPGGINLSAILLMLMGTQWYLLFNVIAGASAIPQDLRYTARLIHLSKWQQWRTLILPALFPYLVTGMITASGGAWNASIVSEYVTFGGKIVNTVGIGALITQSTAQGDYSLLLASTLAMVVTVVLINRLFWRRMYLLAEERYRME